MSADGTGQQRRGESAGQQHGGDSADQALMQLCLAEAASGAALGEVPVGALLTLDGRILARAHNQPIARSDPTAHAEIIALRDAAAALGNYRLVGATLVVTLEPCAMCVGALLHARVGRVVFGCSDAKAGALGGCFDLPAQARFNHAFRVTGGVLADAAREQLQDFFRARRRTVPPLA